MSKRPVPLSRTSGAPRATRAPQAERTLDVRGWLGGIRFSGFMALMLGLVVLAAFVLVPTFSTFVQQRQRIDALQRQVQVTQEQVDDLRAQRERWDDPAYITTQARERLHYQRPGEIVYLVDNDLPEAQQPVEDAEVSAEVTTTRTEWTTQLLSSLVLAGLAETVSEPSFGVPDAPVTETPAP